MHLEQVVINLFSFKDICGWKQSCYYICSVVFLNWKKITKILTAGHQNTEDGQHSTVMYSWAATVKRVSAEHSCHPAFGSGLGCQTMELPGISEVPGVPPPAPPTLQGWKGRSGVFRLGPVWFFGQWNQVWQATRKVIPEREARTVILTRDALWRAWGGARYLPTRWW